MNNPNEGLPEVKIGSSLADSQSQELVPLTNNVPAYVTQGGGRGMENVRKEDLLLPRIVLMQGLTKEVVAQKAKAGDIANSLTGENFGSELTFVPIKNTYSRVMWETRDPGSDIICASDDGKVPAPRIEKPQSPSCENCPMSKFTKGKKGEDVAPACTEFYNFPVLINGKEPAALAFSRSKIATAKKLISQAAYAGKGADLFAMKFKLRSKASHDQKGHEFFVFEIAGAGWASETEYKLAESFYISMKEKNVVIHEENNTHEA